MFIVHYTRRILCVWCRLFPHAPAAYLVDRSFHRVAGVVDLAAQCENLGTGGGGNTDGLKPVSALQDDLRDVAQGFNVVDVGGAFKQTLDRRERGLRPGFTTLAFDGGHQGSFLAAHESAGAQTDVDVKVEISAEDVVAQQAVFMGLLDGLLQALNGDGVLSAFVPLPTVFRVRTKVSASVPVNVIVCPLYHS